jgi:hypothetical protein
VTIECPGCGHRLEVPGDLAEGAELACGHCTLLLRNGPPLRAFRWASVSPEARARASRRYLWGAALGAFLWIPIIGVVLALHRRLDAVLLGTLALPYLALPALLDSRARLPAVIWLGRLWIGVGLYMLYVAAVLLVVPRWNALLASNGLREPPGFLVVFGVISVGTGAAVIALYRRRVARAQQFYGPPPA